jgi:hypothetical protein
MSTVPVPAGAVACIVVAELTACPAAAVVPKLTLVEVGTKPVPVMTTLVPPAMGPAAGDTDTTVGMARKLNWSADEVALVPPLVVTVMSTVPVPTGEVACIVVAELTVWPVAAVVPKRTVVEFITKPVPVMSTFVPPATGPAAGDKEVTVGKGEALARSGKYPITPTVKTITAIKSPRRPAGCRVTEGSSRARKLDEDRRTGPGLMRSTDRFGPVHPDPESRIRLGLVCAASHFWTVPVI